MFGEANAVLAGDGLLTAAFETMLAPGQKLPPERVLEAAGILARAAGGRGMVGGQVLDMAGEGRALGLTEVEELQRLKTGALIRAAVEMGCAVAGGAEEQREACAAMPTAWGWPSRFRTISWTWWVMRPPWASHRFRRQERQDHLCGAQRSGGLPHPGGGVDRPAVEALAPFGSGGGEPPRSAQSLAGREK